MITSTGHDFSSTLCQKRAALQEQLSPDQRRPAERAVDCPACEAQATPTPVGAAAEPMPASELDAIKARHQEVKRLYGEYWVDAGPTDKDMDALLAEVERLTAALTESRRDTHCALTDYALARARADKAETERDKLRVELETAKAVMYRALKEVEHDEVVYLMQQYLIVYPGTTTVFPATTGEGV